MLTKLEKARLLLLVKNEIDELKRIVSEAEKYLGGNRGTGCHVW